MYYIFVLTDRKFSVFRSEIEDSQSQATVRLGRTWNLPNKEAGFFEFARFSDQ
jgi:hypothetical protein